MFLNKYPQPLNFRFVDKFDPVRKVATAGRHTFDVQVRAFENGVWNVRVDRPGQSSEAPLLVDLTPPPAVSELGRLRVGPDLALTLEDESGDVVLSSHPGMAFGVMGDAFLFAFKSCPHQRFYGLGEKVLGKFEYGRILTRFWNADVVGDHPQPVWWDQPTDPYYVSIPYLIIRQGDRYVGLLLENVSCPSIDTGVDASFFGNLDENRRIVLAAEDGVASLWILDGPSLPELTCKLQRLVGVAPRPPLWALGYHQCRWGYRGENDLNQLDQRMTQHDIPNDGLWLDIDYMNGFRVFTINPERFPSGVPATITKLALSGRRVVPILDPGVKLEPGNAVYESGRAAGIFCQNPEGGDFVGMVWPGLTVFPDFTLAKARAWWANYARDFRAAGFAGAWVDMNDPSTGAVDPSAMLWQHGRLPHRRHRNEYALGMQMATREGFVAAAPTLRPFLISRSGSIGTSRFSAIWTGDSASTRFHLQASIPTALNLGLSGIAFHGNDVGGFIGDCSADLMIDWTKATFLFPFFRNHTTLTAAFQEPWAYDDATLAILTRYIKLRYRLLPYLYQQFIRQETDGDPVIRPLLYHYADEESIGDQFLIGPDLLQAPFVSAERSRRLILPGLREWFDLRNGQWTKSGEHGMWADPSTTPLYARDGAIIAARPGPESSNITHLGRVEFHLFVKDESADLTYSWDDGQTTAYQTGAESSVRIEAHATAKVLTITYTELSQGAGPTDASVVVYGDWAQVMLNGRLVSATREDVTWTGQPIATQRLKL